MVSPRFSPSVSLHYLQLNVYMELTTYAQLASKHGDQSELVTDGLDRLGDYKSYVQRVRDLNLSESTSEMARISANVILLLVTITDFLRESVVFLKQSIFKAGVKAGIGNDAVTKGKDALDEAVKEFRSAISDAVNFRALEKD
jgi:hypothetical protein